MNNYYRDEADYNIETIVDDAPFGEIQHPLNRNNGMGGLPGLSDLWSNIQEQGGQILKSELKSTGARIASSGATAIMETPEVKAMAEEKAKEAAIQATASKLTDALQASQAAFKKYKTQIMIGAPIAIGGIILLLFLRRRKKNK